MAGVTGGHKINRFLKKALAAQASSVTSLEVGFFDAEQSRKASANEFGIPSANVPERPAFRAGVDASEDDILQVLRANVDPKTMAVDEATAGKIGTAIVASLRHAYDALKTPPNAAATLRQKAGTNPLVDTKAMLDSLTFKVHKTGGST